MLLRFRTPSTVCPPKRIFEEPAFKTNASLLRVGTKRKAGQSWPGGVGPAVHWLILVLIAVATAILLYGLFRWASADAGIDAETVKERLRGKQDWSGLHRSAIDAPDRQR
jgi:hypothetical protein